MMPRDLLVDRRVLRELSRAAEGAFTCAYSGCTLEMLPARDKPSLDHVIDIQVISRHKTSCPALITIGMHVAGCG